MNSADLFVPSAAPEPRPGHHWVSGSDLLSCILPIQMAGSEDAVALVYVMAVYLHTLVVPRGCLAAQ